MITGDAFMLAKPFEESCKCIVRALIGVEVIVGACLIAAGSLGEADIYEGLPTATQTSVDVDLDVHETYETMKNDVEREMA